MPQREGTAVDEWISEHRELLEQIVELQGLLRYGSIEIVYVDGKPIGFDLHAKTRLNGIARSGESE